MRRNWQKSEVIKLKKFHPARLSLLKNFPNCMFIESCRIIRYFEVTKIMSFKGGSHMGWKAFKISWGYSPPLVMKFWIKMWSYLFKNLSFPSDSLHLVMSVSRSWSKLHRTFDMMIGSSWPAPGISEGNRYQSSGFNTHPICWQAKAADSIFRRNKRLV